MAKHSHISSHGFKAVINQNTKMLILGSFPSIKSREEDFFYMHPQNRFWKILSKLYHDHDFLSDEIEIKSQALKKHHIGLYDVIESCDIVNSRDATITNVEPTNVKELIKGTKINIIFLNGRKAYDLFNKYNPGLKHLGIYLPSSSSANASYNLNRLLNKWKQMIDYT